MKEGLLDTMMSKLKSLKFCMATNTLFIIYIKCQNSIMFIAFNLIWRMSWLV